MPGQTLTGKFPDKPSYLVAYERVKMYGGRLVTGGLMEQPHLWLLEYETIDQMVKVQEHLDRVAQEKT